MEDFIQLLYFLGGKPPLVLVARPKLSLSFDAMLLSLCNMSSECTAYPGLKALSCMLGSGSEDMLCLSGTVALFR